MRFGLMKRASLLLVMLVALNVNAQLPFIKGVYGNPATLLKAGHRFDSLGMNAVFVRSISLNEDFFRTAKQQGCRVYVEFPTLYGNNYLEQHPEAWPINEKGERAVQADWFMGVCLTDPGLKQVRIAELKEISKRYAVDGIFLDYMHWHAQFEKADPILPETCFCDRCTGLFATHIGKAIPGSDITSRAGWILQNAEPAWRKWRSGILNTWIADLRKVLRQERPDARLGVFYCGWLPADHDSALYRKLGIDVAGLAREADILAPMLFHGMYGKSAGWVGEYMEWLDRELKSKSKTPLVWPIVQAHNKPATISADEFQKVMNAGMSSPSSGIMMFADGSLLEDPEKLKVMKTIYRSK
ncbi:MAG TPA: hypothetical protein VLA58_11820 [Chitinophagaceae bacterium]|nr:hypothetical protein [Chitinophagaceae bacterium]